jgi:DNA repair protein RadC
MEPTVADQSQVLVPLHPVALPIAPPAPPPRVTIKDWPRADRPRDKLLDRGPGTLSDAELLAIILGSGSAGISALDQGRTIMQRFPDFRHLATVGAGDLCSITGLGPTKAAQILAAIEMAKRYGEQEFRPGEPLRGSGDVYSHFRERLASEQREVFYAVLLDNKNFGKTGTREQIVHIQTTVTAVPARPRVAARPAQPFTRSNICTIRSRVPGFRRGGQHSGHRFGAAHRCG